jgi:hypothetical protein
MRAHCNPCGEALIPQARYAQPHTAHRRVFGFQRRFRAQAQPLSVRTSATPRCFLSLGVDRGVARGVVNVVSVGKRAAAHARSRRAARALNVDRRDHGASGIMS